MSQDRSPGAPRNFSDDEESNAEEQPLKRPRMDISDRPTKEEDKLVHYHAKLYLYRTLNSSSSSSSSSTATTIRAGSSNNPPSLEPEPEPVSYECQQCGKAFSKYQALGGHKASHRKPSSSDKVDPSTCTLPASGRPRHECSTCHVVFPTGQALGGHMRRHYKGPTTNNKNNKVNDPVVDLLWLRFSNNNDDDNNNIVDLELSLGVGGRSKTSQSARRGVVVFGIDLSSPVVPKEVPPPQLQPLTSGGLGLCKSEQATKEVITCPIEEDKKEETHVAALLEPKESN